eukprot:1182968-Prorocentrum_minimum.AAC.2
MSVTQLLTVSHSPGLNLGRRHCGSAQTDAPAASRAAYTSRTQRSRAERQGSSIVSSVTFTDTLDTL